MKIGVDIGGVLSAYPEEMHRLIASFVHNGHEIHVITDMHEREETLTQLRDNGFGYIPAERVHNADYAKYGEMCKQVLMRDLGIDIHIDDFPGYMAWDSSLGKAPLRLLVCPDAFRPYWHPDWKCSGAEFGRRVATLESLTDGGTNG